MVQELGVTHQQFATTDCILEVMQNQFVHLTSETQAQLEFVTVQFAVASVEFDPLYEHTCVDLLDVGC